MLKSMMYTTVYVTDQDEALAFYEDRLAWRSESTIRALTGDSLPSASPTALSRSSCGRVNPASPRRKAEPTPARFPAPSSWSPKTSGRHARSSAPAASPSRSPSRWTTPSASGPRRSTPTATASHSANADRAGQDHHGQDGGASASLDGDRATKCDL